MLEEAFGRNGREHPRRIRLFTLPMVLLIIGVLSAGASALRTPSLDLNTTDDYQIEVAGKAWNLLEDPVIDIVIIPNPSLSGWRDSYVEDVKQAFRDWITCIQIFASKYDYAYLSKIRFDVTVADSGEQVARGPDITVRWEDRFDFVEAAGASVLYSDSKGEIIRASITLPVTVTRDGERYQLSDTHIQYIMADEIGHALGLKHSNFKGDILYEAYDLTQKPDCHSSLDIYGLAMVYRYLSIGIFEPPPPSTVSLQGTGIAYHPIRNGE